MRKLGIAADPNGRLVEVWETTQDDDVAAAHHQTASGIVPEFQVHVIGSSLLPSLPGIVVRLNRAMDWIPEG